MFSRHRVRMCRWLGQFRACSYQSRINGPLLSYLDNIASKYTKLNEKLDSIVDHKELAVIGKEVASLQKIMTIIDEKKSIDKSIKDLVELELEETKKVGNSQDNVEMLELVKQEKMEAINILAEVEERLINVLTPTDDADDKNVVVEVRAGTGGDEASLFASEIFKMYQKYAVLRGWKWEQLALTKTEIGGFKEAQASIHGESVFKYLKFESGIIIPLFTHSRIDLLQYYWKVLIEFNEFQLMMLKSKPVRLLW